MKKKKSGFFSFCFSFIPGAVEMYIGFYKMGISIMGTFGLIAFISSFTGIGEIMVFDFIVYAFAFFHAHNFAGMTEKELNEIEDDYIFNEFLEGKKLKISDEKIRKIVAIALIFIGAKLCLREFMYRLPVSFYDPTNFFKWSLYRFFNHIDKLVIGVFIIVIGVKMICGKKETLFDDEETNEAIDVNEERKKDVFDNEESDEVLEAHDNYKKSIWEGEEHDK